MHTPLKVWVDPGRLAPGQALSGTVAAAELEQLSGIVLDSGAAIEVSLVALQRPSGRLGLDGSLRAELALCCQRCLQTMDWPLEREVAVELVASDAEAAKVHGDAEPYLLVDGRLMLRELVAEEVLLALPIAPRHAECAPLDGDPANE